MISSSIWIKPLVSGNPYVKLVNEDRGIDVVLVLISTLNNDSVFNLVNSSTLTYWSRFSIKSRVPPCVSWET